MNVVICRGPDPKRADEPPKKRAGIFPRMDAR